VAEECRRLLDLLGCSEPTVERRLQLIRRIWDDHCPG
jgi:hypothetical protein